MKYTRFYELFKLRIPEELASFPANAIGKSTVFRDYSGASHSLPGQQLPFTAEHEGYRRHDALGLGGKVALHHETILAIKELLGHKALEMTLRYAHLIPDQKRQAALRLEWAFRKGNNMQ